MAKSLARGDGQREDTIKRIKDPIVVVTQERLLERISLYLQGQPGSREPPFPRGRYEIKEKKTLVLGSPDESSTTCFASLLLRHAERKHS